MSDLSEFLLARIAEDEAAATDAHAHLLEHAQAFYDDEDGADDWRRAWVGFGQSAWTDGTGRMDAHIHRHDPARVLAECESKRRIVERYAGWCARIEHGAVPSLVGWAHEMYGRREAIHEALRLLALPYADHPDYRSEWSA